MTAQSWPRNEEGERMNTLRSRRARADPAGKGAWRLACLLAEGRASRSFDVEANPLGQLQSRREVHRLRLPSHVRLPGVAARFAAPAGLLLTTERAADF